MIGKEVERVIKGEYSNPKMDAYMDDLLLHSMLTLDLSTYINMRKLRTNSICDNYYEKLQLHYKDNVEGLTL